MMLPRFRRIRRARDDRMVERSDSEFGSLSDRAGQSITHPRPERPHRNYVSRAVLVILVDAKVGAEDAFASPDLVPGSVIRADTRRADEALTPVADNA